MTLDKTIEIKQGDCLELIKKLPDASIDAIITDPPYFLGMTHNGQKGCFNDLVICKPFYNKLFTEYKRILKPDHCMYFFCDWRSYAFYYPLLNASLKVDNMLVWVKHGRPTKTHYGYGNELILFSGNIKQCYISNVIQNVKSFNLIDKTKEKKVHPTQKPVELIEKFILDSTNDNEIILDTFMGSGSTGVACINTGRHFIGYELDEAYFGIAKSRLENALKEKTTDLPLNGGLNE